MPNTNNNSHSLDEIVYLAATLDGEGYVGIMKTPYGGQSCIKVAQTDYHWIERLENTWGGSMREEPPRSPKHSKQWVWFISGHDIVAILNAVKPYLRLKNRQAELCLKLQQRIDGRYGTVKTRGKGDYIVTANERLLRAELYKQCKLHNKRGPTDDEIQIPILFEDQNQLNLFEGGCNAQKATACSKG